MGTQAQLAGVRYVRDPSAEVRISALVNGVQFKRREMGARGRNPGAA